MNEIKVPYNKPYLTGSEKEYVLETLSSSGIASDGKYTKRCIELLKKCCPNSHILMTPSCTSALEMAMHILKLPRGSEVILPSYTFSSTANAVLLAGCIPVFADVDLETLNINPKFIEKLINNNTKAIMPMHYAGIGCDMMAINELADKHNLFVIEDAAQTIGANRFGKMMGVFGDMGAISFHNTKNVVGGEGGALLVNLEKWLADAYVFRDKGTNRQEFLNGKVDKYYWLDIGSSVVPTEMGCAVIASQLEALDKITKTKSLLWHKYHQELSFLEKQGKIMLAKLPENAETNGHIFWLMVENKDIRSQLIEHLADNGIQATTHFVPLHSSPAGLKYCKTPFALPNTEKAGGCLLRLPIYPELAEQQQDYVIKTVKSFF